LGGYHAPVSTLDIEKHIYKVLAMIPKLEDQAGSGKAFEKMLHEFYENGASWDISEEKMIQRYGKDYKKKFK
jgi:hypothetical protein